MNIIPLVLSADKYYAPFMYTTMLSALQNAKENTFYNFYLLIPSILSKKDKEKIVKLKGKYKCNINFIDMKEHFNNLPWTPAAWYRLLVAELLPKQYDKCIYLDDDISVCCDLKKLYDIELNNNYCAGVIACQYYIYGNEYHCKRLGIPSTKRYINSGVLLINLKQIRNDNITSQFIEASREKLHDQDVINKVCYGKIKVLPPKYNVMIKHLFINNTRLNDLYSKEEIEEAKKNPCIIHYCDIKRPWEGFYKYSGYWWKNAIKTPYKFYFIFIFTKNLLNPIPKIKNIIKGLIPKSIKDTIKKELNCFFKQM